MMKPIVTRFRAYQLGSAGSSFSYFAGGHFTIMEARLTELNRPQLEFEMKLCGVSSADILHITSWDADHCATSELEALLALTTPSRIECPGYDPHCDHAERAAAIIVAYEKSRRQSNRIVAVECITPGYIAGLSFADRLAFTDIFYHPQQIDPQNNNDNSTVKFLRRGAFNVLSLGDVESVNLSAQLRRQKFLGLETDVIILAHHGADNGFTNKKFLRHVEPLLAICSSNFDNQHDHPDEAIRDLLYELGIRLMTTKTGDVLVHSIGDHTGSYRAVNFKSNSTEISSTINFRAKKAELLSYNGDTIRQIYEPRSAHR
jgi:competence protein ComEC